RTAELTQTNVALHNERARLMTILEHLPVGVVFSDAATGKTLLANPRAKQIWHYETPPDSCAPEFARSQGFFPDGRPYRVEDWPMQRALKNGETTTEEEIAFIHGDGTRGVMQASAAPIHDPEGRVTAAVLTFADITARKRLEQELRALNAELEQRVREQTAALQQHNEELEIAEEELRQQTEELLAARAHAEQERRRYQALFEFAPDGYLITDREGIILEANEAALVLLRVPPNFLPGKPLRVFIAQAETKEFHARLTHLLQTEKTEEWELSVQPRSGAAFAAGLRVAPVIDANGKVMTLRWLLRDITARKEAEEALARHARDLARANADLRQIAYVAAHDLQEPVRQVGVYTQKIAARYQDSLDAATREAADFLVEGSRRMIAQLNDLMHYLEVDEAATERVITNCEVVFQRALAHIHEAIAANDATITHDPLPTVEAHPAHLQLVFQELLDNAVKFRTAAPPQVHVWAEREAHGWRFAVRDHGISIDPQYY